LNKADVIVLAAGKGARMMADTNKMFLSIKNVPILYRTLFRLNQHARIGQIFVVCREEEKRIIKEMVKKHGPIEKLSQYISGGKERCDSVRNGLMAVLQNAEGKLVMTHDGARPFFSMGLIDRLIDSIKDEKISIPVIGISETLRRMRKNGRTEVVDRQSTYLVQTPQLFSTEMIPSCFLSNRSRNQILTDEASYFEAAGKEVVMINGEKWNIKITTPEDIEWAECLLNRYPDLRLKNLD